MGLSTQGCPHGYDADRCEWQIIPKPTDTTHVNLDDAKEDDKTEYENP